MRHVTRHIPLRQKTRFPCVLYSSGSFPRPFESGGQHRVRKCFFSSSIISTRSNRVRPESCSKSTSTSISLSGLKSSRNTEPKRANSFTFHFLQNSDIFSLDTYTGNSFCIVAHLINISKLLLPDYLQTLNPPGINNFNRYCLARCKRQRYGSPERFYLFFINLGL